MKIMGFSNHMCHSVTVVDVADGLAAVRRAVVFPSHLVIVSQLISGNPA
jgi:hypothetical protein